MKVTDKARADLDTLKQCLERKRKGERYHFKALKIEQLENRRVKIYMASAPPTPQTMEKIFAPCGYVVRQTGNFVGPPSRYHYLIAERVNNG